MILCIKEQYDIGRYGMAEILQQYYGTPLEKLHTTKYAPDHLLSREDDQYTDLHSAFYVWFHNTELFNYIYREFIKHEIIPKFGNVVFQRTPNIRIQFPGNVAVGEFHKDSDYGHSPMEVNIWVPLTRVAPSNAVIYEAYLKRLYTPMLYGEYLIFDGANLTHGNVESVEHFTRVSIDFRIIPKTIYRETPGRTTINTKQKYILGEYWDEF